MDEKPENYYRFYSTKTHRSFKWSDYFLKSFFNEWCYLIYDGFTFFNFPVNVRCSGDRFSHFLSYSSRTWHKREKFENPSTEEYREYSVELYTWYYPSRFFFAIPSSFGATPKIEEKGDKKERNKGEKGKGGFEEGKKWEEVGVAKAPRRKKSTIITIVVTSMRLSDMLEKKKKVRLLTLPRSIPFLPLPARSLPPFHTLKTFWL